MAAKLKHFDRHATLDDMMAALDSDAAFILDGLLTPAQVGQFANELAPLLNAGETGGDSFSGYKTKRVGALIARSEICRQIATDPLLLGVAEKLLGPFSPTLQLSLTQAVSIGPNEGGQILHRDRGLWGGHIPRRIEPQLGTMLAVTDFTHDNGATRVVPGSQIWDRDRQPEPDEIASAEMKAGSILIYTGTVIHGGGANMTAQNRVGLLLHYTLGWLRQQENMYLSCPPDIAKDFTPKLRRLLGYAQGSPVMGFYSDPYKAQGGGAEAASPEHVFGDAVTGVAQRTTGEDVVQRTKGQ